MKLKNKIYKSLKSFTMAEILISMTIIGIVATLCLPSLTGNVNERSWATQRKALLARFSQALTMLPALNGHGVYTGSNNDTAAASFVNEVIDNVFEIKNFCDDPNKLYHCGLPDEIVKFDGSKTTFPKKLSNLSPNFSGTGKVNTKAAAFVTKNGESIAVYYDPICVSADTSYKFELEDAPDNKFIGNIPAYMCANFIFDLNGKKGPNTLGRDIGIMTAIYATDTVIVAPIMNNEDSGDSLTFDEARDACLSLGQDFRLPNVDELASLFYNRNLIGLEEGIYWSSTEYEDDDDYAWAIYPGSNDSKIALKKTNGGRARCVHR